MFVGVDGAGRGERTGIVKAAGITVAVIAGTVVGAGSAVAESEPKENIVIDITVLRAAGCLPRR